VQSCKHKAGPNGMNGFDYVDSCQQMEANLTVQPFSAVVDATHFKNYQSGVFNNCGKGHNLATLLVGGSRDYYRLKLSWGRFWGEDGFIRLTRNGQDVCGLCSGIYIPIALI
jgi:hypothetical protein